MTETYEITNIQKQDDRISGDLQAEPYRIGKWKFIHPKKIYFEEVDGELQFVIEYKDASNKKEVKFDYVAKKDEATVRNYFEKGQVPREEVYETIWEGHYKPIELKKKPSTEERTRWMKRETRRIVRENMTLPSMESDDKYLNLIQLAYVNVVGKRFIFSPFKNVIGKLGPYSNTSGGGQYAYYSPHYTDDLIKLENSEDIKRIKKILKDIEGIEDVENKMGEPRPEGIFIHTKYIRPKKIREVEKKIDSALKKEFSYYESMLY